ncbi:hypothetical protein HKO46_07830 [Streptococcus equi subsp. zooepidemicus]|uniref:ABC-three component system protein n=5 Tax=Streptococcus equi TaxID=1336 RepID=UPI0002D9A513|nr:ABC-three component system protein [Streptococcus equi]AIA68603.1 hypothetical protein Q426_01890 [Streptococcus equi subsp. zooepidemicus CY]MBR7753892.1 hypothetical protein [Streptococcus equi subsp. zooepidemicus]MBR7776569.1 hypothetical protein [Streptococcus equi subsp. zooepidemicus]NMW55691.1 hypothetical protein [Streptococcus equi subsp. zooepidemicus]NPU62992.1 hypothetical protein [Streptococcus equi subsp. zooepidemicus]
MAGKKNNATSSWSGYNHQGQVGIFLALKELRVLLQKSKDYNDYSVEFEKEDGEDVDIVQNNTVISRHQVKAKTTSKNLNAYKDVLERFNITDVGEDSRYLHTIREVIGFGLPQSNFDFLFQNQKGTRPKFVENVCRIKLFQYPDGKNYCELSDVSESKIDFFCKMEIKRILIQCSHSLKDDDNHINETLFELKDLLCTKIRGAHEAGGNANPVISFLEIYEIVTSTKKREQQAIHRAKSLFEIYWNKNIDDNVNEGLFVEILNLPNKEFEAFIIDLHPQKSIGALKEIHSIDSLLDEDIFEEIFYEFYKQIRQEFFDISEVRYRSKESSYRLSLINKKCKNGEVGKLVQSIRNNRQFLKASFDVDYLVNGRINSSFFNQEYLDNELSLSYDQQPTKRDNLFSNHLEFIDIDKTVEKLKGERYE